MSSQGLIAIVLVGARTTPNRLNISRENVDPAKSGPDVASRVYWVNRIASLTQRRQSEV
jgi:hypothetical protein